MKPKIVRHGIKHILADIDVDRANCPDCDFISITTSNSWKDIWLIGDEGKEVGVGYECPRCLCRFEYIKEAT
jgi:hypothetical protein